MDYQQFLARKSGRVDKPGREVTAGDVHPMLHDLVRAHVIDEVTL